MEYALYRGYWLRFTPKGIDVLGPSRRRVLGSFLSASSARLHVRALARP